ncbi:hypothetical protein JQW78_20285 [Sulfitobacter pseudonitzschiae]|nr:hypothetical protein [Pseudosulfitobacter pseudonitzschiae]
MVDEFDVEICGKILPDPTDIAFFRSPRFTDPWQGTACRGVVGGNPSGSG